MVVPTYAEVGCRIETTDGARAVVRYVGPVEAQDGIWIGVEWDDPTRGKHDGSHGGKRYFECTASSEDGATPGSFVRPHKIRPSVTFREAIATKYLDGKLPIASAALIRSALSSRTYLPSVYPCSSPPAIAMRVFT